MYQALSPSPLKGPGDEAILEFVVGSRGLWPRYRTGIGMHEMVTHQPTSCSQQFTYVWLLGYSQQVQVHYVQL